MKRAHGSHRTMSAVVVRDGACALVRDWPVPKPCSDEVLIKVVATAVNRLDTIQRRGRAMPPPGVTEVLGLEVAGTIVERGATVAAEWQPGVEVMALVPGGAYAEYVAVHASTLMRKPASLSWAAAASLPEAWLTAYQLVHMVGEVQPGETVLIHAAASGVGLAAVQLVAAAGATPLVTVGSAEKLALCVRLGAKGGAIRHDGPWLEAVRALAPGGAVHVALDPVCGDYAAAHLDVLGVDGRWVLYSAMSGAALPANLGATFLASLMRKRIHLKPSLLRSRPQAYKAELVRRFKADALQRVGAPAGFEHRIDREFSGLGSAQAAHDYMESNANSGKIVIAGVGAADA